MPAQSPIECVILDPLSTGKMRLSQTACFILLDQLPPMSLFKNPTPTYISFRTLIGKYRINRLGHHPRLPDSSIYGYEVVARTLTENEPQILMIGVQTTQGGEQPVRSET